MLKKEFIKFSTSGLVMLLLTTHLYAQPITLSREIGANLGFSSFLGDLGGSDDVGRAFWWDIDPQITRPALGFVYRQEIIPRTAFRFNAYASILKGDDALTDNEFRHYRNLSFRSPIVEASGSVELSAFRFTGVKKKKWTPYIYGGVGAFYFNPQAQYNGEWVNLQPLGTEGQGLPEYPDRQKYSKIAVCFPVGGGFRYITDRDWVLGFEMAARFTNTDYIDDVSGYYPNPDYYYLHYDLETALMAATLSDPSDHTIPEWTQPEYGRGDPTNNDSYIFGGMLTFTYHMEFQRKVNTIKCYFNQDNK
ncbi:MAG TPA: DUF6089 family protein [Chitinophagales bacterium]|nr:hypothetical protein [Chitinophagales bacterium]HMU69553.1 DUF6089 family protein [Chitinophagales bacterium]HMZ89906.1 DUF6089 family protein [Chitinophagales bacterium]HNA56570.1 DUF6089 family protein [Chitinophagales bacterium]HNE45417.1 DUF6089 family protein [Chitinophagales bacterium]